MQMYSTIDEAWGVLKVPRKRRSHEKSETVQKQDDLNTINPINNDNIKNIDTPVDPLGQTLEKLHASGKALERTDSELLNLLLHISSGIFLVVLIDVILSFKMK